MGEIYVANSYVNTVSVISDAASAPNTGGGTITDNNDKKTPGFELVIVIGAAAIVLFLKRKR